MLQNIEKEYERIKFLEPTELDLLRKAQKNEALFFIKKLQEQLKITLSEYLNTPIFLSKRTASSYLETLELLKYFGYRGKNENLTINKLPDFLKEGYLHFEKLEKLEKVRKGYSYEARLKFNKFKPSNYSNKWPEKFNNFARKEFEPYVSTLFIHGSCSDLQLTPFSDLDTFVIIKKETILESQKLIRFKRVWDKSLKYLYKFDGLQHHNHMIATDFDLKAFPYHWLPPQVINGSTLILGDCQMKIQVVKTQYFILRAFYQLLQRYRDPKIHQKVYNRYTLKNDISVIALFPVLFLQGLGIDSTKKESFTDSNLAEVEGIRFYNRITEFRENWKVPLITIFLLSTLYQPYLRILFLKFFMDKEIKSVFLKNSILKEDFMQQLIDITNCMSQTLITKHLNYEN